MLRFFRLTAAAVGVCLLWLTVLAGSASGQVCLPSDTALGDHSIFNNTGPTAVVWLHLYRDTIGTGPARLEVRDTLHRPRAAADTVTEGGRTVVSLEVPRNHWVWVSPGAQPADTLMRAGIRYQVCF